MKKIQKFTLTYDIKLIGVNIEVEAESIESALTRARTFKHSDLFEEIGVNDRDILDSEVELTGIWK